MIQINELRIGNWVNWKGSPRQWEREDFEDAYIELFAYIELTPDWLKRAGFKQSGYHEMLLDVDGRFSLRYDYHLKRFYISIYEEWIQIILDYVHSLQNLYYALTGTELEFKL